MGEKTVSEEKMRQLGLNLFYGEFVFSDLWFTSKHFEQKSNRELADLIVCGKGTDCISGEREEYGCRGKSR